MKENNTFKTWAVVEVMGHVEFAGFVQQEVIAGIHMLRVDVPKTEHLEAFTKYIAPNALYGISPCTEQTARARAEANGSHPFSSWSVEQQLMDSLKKRGLLIEPPRSESSDDEELPF
ncbi:hypothetical protein [Methylobacterium oryzae]|uniref:hypothetical protein n=1 Tax=Methylobacterium oryzae TaxID=334852 RepID=UPI002F357E6A